MHLDQCAGCAARLPLLRAPGRARKWCSERCRLRHLRSTGEAQPPDYSPRSSVHFLHCSECHRLWCARTSKARTCGPDCSRARKARMYREKYAADRESELARHRALRANQSEEKRSANRARNQRRRAAIFGVEAERFTPLEIYERDRWVCGICEQRIDRDIRWPHPQSPSLDHVVPLSLGGHHTRANSRASHLHCNVARGNRVS